MIHDDDSISVDLGPRSYEIPIVSQQLAHCAKVFEQWWYVRDGMSTAFSTKRPPHGSVNTINWLVTSPPPGFNEPPAI